MPTPSPRSDRIELRISAAEKQLLTRAAALERMDMTSFVLRNVLPHAEDVVSRAERIALSTRDSLKILDLLENPPPPTDRLVDAARFRLPKE